MKEFGTRAPPDGDRVKRTDRARSRTGSDSSIRGSSLAPVPPTATAILELQRSAGNAATASLFSSQPHGLALAMPVAQRFGHRVPTLLAPPTEGVQRAAADTVQRAPDTAKPSWNPPHLCEDDGLIPVTDHYQARNNLQMIALTLQPLADCQLPMVQVVLNKVNQARTAMSEKGDLTQEEVTSLEALHGAGLMVYRAGAKQMQDTFEESLKKYKMPEGFGEASDQVMEMLHEGFTGDHSVLQHAKHASHSIHTAEENLHYLVEWAEAGLGELKMLDAEGIMAAKYFEHAHSTYSSIIHGTGRVLPWLVAVHGAMQAVWESASAVEAAHDSSISTAKKGAAGIEASTAVVQGALGAAALVGVQAAAGFGLVWANVIVPQTQQALKALDRADKALGKGARLGQAEWWAEETKKGGSAPIIPKEFVVQNWFPGGQVTLNYMWAVFQGNPPEDAPAVVTKFFYDNRKKMNEEEEDNDKLDTEWHLLRANEVKNLKEWVVEHKTTVWGMLYGSLPHP